MRRHPGRSRHLRRSDVHHEEAHFTAHSSARHGCDDGTAVPGCHGPGQDLLAKTAAAGKIRLSCIEQVHGAAGSTKIGLEKNMWSPAAAGRTFDLSPTSLSPLEPYRNYLTIVSNTDVRNAEAFAPNEIGGDHFRSSAVFLTQAHPETDGGVGRPRRPLHRSALRAEVRAGHSHPVDAVGHRERRSGGRLRVWLCLCLHRHDQLGRRRNAFADDSRPALRIRSAVWRRRDARRTGGAAHDRPQHPRLDHRPKCHGCATRLARAIARASTRYLDDVREVERRIQRVEAQNATRRTARVAGRARRACPTRLPST